MMHFTAIRMMKTSNGDVVRVGLTWKGLLYHCAITFGPFLLQSLQIFLTISEVSVPEAIEYVFFFITYANFSLKFLTVLAKGKNVMSLTHQFNQRRWITRDENESKQVF